MFCGLWVFRYLSCSRHQTGWRRRWANRGRTRKSAGGFLVCPQPIARRRTRDTTQIAQTRFTTKCPNISSWVDAS
jgi:hypothetical protein